MKLNHKTVISLINLVLIYNSPAYSAFDEYTRHT